MHNMELKASTSRYQAVITIDICRALSYPRRNVVYAVGCYDYLESIRSTLNLGQLGCLGTSFSTLLTLPEAHCQICNATMHNGKKIVFHMRDFGLHVEGWPCTI